jgi:hypothetical protein
MSTLEYVLSTVLHPIKWFANRRVDDLANTIAIRRAILREMVRLSFQRYVHELVCEKLDSDRERGLRERVIEKLQQRFDWAIHDPEQENMRSEIAKAVTLAVVDSSVWLALSELRSREPFNSEQSFVLEYRDKNGTTHHSTTDLPRLQQYFLFFKPFTFAATPGALHVVPQMSASISHEVSGMIDERIADEPFKILRFELRQGPVDPFATFANMGSGGGS